MDHTLASTRHRPRPILLGTVLLSTVLVTACGSTTPPMAPSVTATSTSPAVAMASPLPGLATTTPVTPTPVTPAPVTLTPIPLPVTTPAPFGPAADGRLLYVLDGVLTWFDIQSGATGAIVAGVPAQASVMPSRDGTKVALISQTSTGSRQLAVVSVDGRGLRTIPGTWSDDAEFDWSPSGEAIAVASDDTGIAKITIVPVDGSMPQTLDSPMDTRHQWYLPDGRLMFKGTRETPDGQRFALYAVDPTAGGDATRINAETSEGMDVIDASPSADGSRLVYHRWHEPDEKGRIRLIDVSTGVDKPLAVEYPNEEFADELAQFSPDGRQVLFIRYLAAGNQLMLVPLSGGAPRAVGELTPGNDNPQAMFSPDGRSILARYHDGHVWVLDATGTGKDRQLDLTVNDLPAWQRIAP